MKQTLKKSIAILLTLCSLLVLLVPAASAAAVNLQPETYLDSIIYTEFSGSTYAISQVNGENYMFIPYLGTLFIFNMDTWEFVDTQYFESDKSRNGAFVDSKGIVWIYGPSELYRYDPIAKKMNMYTVPFDTIGCSRIYTPVELDGCLYFCTYGAASTGGAKIIKFDPSTFAWTDLIKLDPAAMYASAMTYHNGYIYVTCQNNKANKQPQYVVKYDPVNNEIIQKFDIFDDGEKPYYSTVPYFHTARVAGDVLFIGGNPQRSMLAIDISGDTMKFAEDLVNMPVKGGIQRGISEVYDGKIYFARYDSRESETTGTWRASNYLYSYDIATKTFTMLTDKAMPGEIRTKGNSIVTLKNEQLGLDGTYIVTLDEGPAGPTLVFYDLEGGRHETPSLAQYDVPNRLISMTLGPDGKTIYTSSYMENTTAAFDITTNTIVKTLSTNSEQCEENFFHNGKWYVTTYGGCNLSEVNEDGTVNLLFSLNDDLINKENFKQERMHNFTGGGNKVFCSTVPHKGLVGGYIVWYDYDKKATYVAVEEDLVLYSKDTSSGVWYNAKTDALHNLTGEKFKGLVANQMIKTLVYHDGLIYASTTNQGGSQTDPVPGETAKLIVYDPTKMEMVAVHDIREGIKGLNDQIAAITGIVADPNEPGKFWGLVSGTLFNFTFDKDTKTFDVNEVLSYTKKNSIGTSPAVWSPWKCYFNDGYLYFSYDKRIVMLSTEDTSYYAEIPASVGGIWVLGSDNNAYFANGASVDRYVIADVIAEVKAGKDDAAKEAAAAVQAKIDALGKITLESEAAIKEARAAYDAMSDVRKALVNADALTAAEATLLKLQNTAPISPVVYILIAVAAAAAIAGVVVVLIRRKKKN